MCVYVYMYIYIFVYIYIYVYLCIYIYICVYIYICIYIYMYTYIYIYIYGCFLKWGARKSSVAMVVFICFHHIRHPAIGFPPSDSQPVPSSSSWRSYWSSVAWPATSGVIHRRPGWEEAARCCTRTFEMPTWWRRKRKSPRFFSKLIEKYHGVLWMINGKTIWTSIQMVISNYPSVMEMLANQKHGCDRGSPRYNLVHKAKRMKIHQKITLW